MPKPFNSGVTPKEIKSESPNDVPTAPIEKQAAQKTDVRLERRIV